MRLASSMDMLVFSTDSPAAGSESMQERSRAIVPVALSPPGHLPVAANLGPLSRMETSSLVSSRRKSWKK